MLYVGEQLGTGRPPMVDVVVDPVEGTTLLAMGLPNAVSVVALAERGTLYDAHGLFYMDKLAVAPAGRHVCSLELSVEDNLHALARVKGERIDGRPTVVVLDRPRHTALSAHGCNRRAAKTHPSWRRRRGAHDCHPGHWRGHAA